MPRNECIVNTSSRLDMVCNWSILSVSLSIASFAQWQCSLVSMKQPRPIWVNISDEMLGAEDITTAKQRQYRDDVIKLKHFPRYWLFVRGIHRSPVNSPHKGQWRGALMFSLICIWINGWVNNREAGDLRRNHGHYDVVVMGLSKFCLWCIICCICALYANLKRPEPWTWNAMIDGQR